MENNANNFVSIDGFLTKINNLKNLLTSDIPQFTKDWIEYKIKELQSEINNQINKSEGDIDELQKDVQAVKNILDLSKSDLFALREEVGKTIPFAQCSDSPKRFRWKFPRNAHGAGIYILWEGEELIYIGESGDCCSRLKQHIGVQKSKNKNTTHITLFKLSCSFLIETERLLIEKFKPKNNTKYLK